MGRLFWKFFLVFWLALLLAGLGVGTAVWLHHNGQQTGMDDKQAPDVDDRHAGFLLDLAESANHYGGADELRHFLDQLQITPLPKVYAINEMDKDILQREVSSDVLVQVRALFLQGGHPDTVRSVFTTDGHRYLLFAPLPKHDFLHLPPPRPGDGNTGTLPDFGPQPYHRHSPHPEPPSALLPVIAGLLASIIFSAALAWYFATPIRRLRQAFAAVGQGDLQTRVGNLMGNRRDELADLGQEFDHMARQIHHLVHAQQRLLHDVSHELRSPLARIQAAIGLAQQQPEKRQAMLARIDRESLRINALVGELLALSRLEAGVSVSEYQEFDIGGLLDDIVEDARFEAEQSGVSINYQCISETQVNACGELLHRAIENVLRNAVQHCARGGEVRLQAGFDAEKRRLSIAVEDQGPGVAESELKAIFDPFFRSEKTRKSSRSGIGLGLAIARRAIEVHGGSIQAFNRLQGGLRVEIAIPFAG